MKKRIFSLAIATMMGGFLGTAQAAEALYPPAEQWGWTGFFGSFDKAAAQRGLQVYVEVCASCHGLKHIRYRNLTELGYSPEMVKAFAAEYEVEDGPNDEGEMFMRPAKPADAFVSPYANDEEAKFVNGGALPPDLSLIVKSRAKGEGSIPVNFVRWISGRGTASGADYIYHMMTGYLEEDEAEAWLREQWEHKKAAGDLTEEELEAGFSFEFPEGKYFNKWFGGHAITMPPPLSEGLVEYEDGTEASMEQMARDVTTFLAWASEPELDERKKTGFKVLLFLAALLVLAIAAKRRLWRNVH